MGGDTVGFTCTAFPAWVSGWQGWDPRSPPFAKDFPWLLSGSMVHWLYCLRVTRALARRTSMVDGSPILPWAPEDPR